LKNRITTFFRGGLGITFVATLGLASSTIAAFNLKLADDVAIRQEIERRATLRHALLNESLSEYDSALFALRLLIENSTDLSQAEFNQAAGDITNRSTGIQAIQWAPVLHPDTLASFVAHARTAISPDFTVRQLGPDGQLEPLSPTPRDHYAPITYVYPLAGNETTIGYDIFTAPASTTLALAYANPHSTFLSQPFNLIQGGEGVILACVADRPASGIPAPNGGPGIVQIVLRLEDAIRRQWNLTPNSTIDVLLADITTPLNHPFFLQIAGRLKPETKLPDEPAGFITPETINYELRIGGRTWRAYYRPNPEWVASRSHRGAYLTLFGGTGLTLLTVLYLVSLRRRHEHIRRQVAERTAELNESRLLLNAIIDHNPSSIWVKDTSLRYRIVNHTFARYHQLDRDQIIGQTDDRFYSPEETRQIIETDHQVLSSGTAFSFESHFSLKKSATATFLVSKFPIHNSVGVIDGIAGIATEITALRAAEAATLIAERRAQESRKLESIGVLAGGVAHDFNNLLTGILGHANLARLTLDPASPTQESLAQIEIAVQRAAELCQQMLAYSGRGRLSVKPIQLGHLVQDTISLIRHSLPPAAEILLEVAHLLPPVSVDAVQLRQITMNLVLNAAEALVDGRGTVTLRTRLVAADPALFATCVAHPDLPSGDYLCLEISDTGSGMPPDTLARIFEPFFSTKFTGRGLGLAATLGIVRSHNGALAVSSTPGQGTSFRLYLPALPELQPSTVSPGSDVTPSPRPPQLPGAPHLLLVDDDESVRDTAALLLASIGYKITTAPDGPQALVRFAARPGSFDAAIVDLTMPGLGGVEVLERLRLLRPGLPVLIISGYSEQDVRLDPAISQRVDFLSKPFSLEQIRDKLKTLIPQD
jgi:PAS domain S-box-containing protein